MKMCVRREAIDRPAIGLTRPASEWNEESGRQCCPFIPLEYDSQDDRMLIIKASGFQNVMALTRNDGNKCSGAEEVLDPI